MQSGHWTFPPLLMFPNVFFVLHCHLCEGTLAQKGKMVLALPRNMDAPPHVLLYIFVYVFVL